MSRFKFRLWNSCRSAKVSWTAELRKAIIWICGGHGGMLWPLFILLSHTPSPRITFQNRTIPLAFRNANICMHQYVFTSALSHENRQHPCLTCQRWGAVARKNSGDYRRDCSPSAPSMRFSTLSQSLFVLQSSVCLYSFAFALSYSLFVGAGSLPRPLHRSYWFSQRF